MEIFLVCLLVFNGLIGFLGFRYLNKSKYLFSDRFAFIAALTASTIVSLVTALNLFLLFPDYFSVISGLNMILGIGIGAVFGAMVNAQSFIAGLFNGGVGGIMGTMIGAVTMNPSICSLPVSSLSGQTVILFFGLFSFILLSTTFSLLCFALRV
ncbi:hypothetical protein [Peribacillus glennii]|uniref:Uncharacterized protein n=1 Tax=Peribacillus glennii TaxID=2303991 RepID=A0A372L8J9_9BACI|nr:hypothetical protein [Peribacillus glennii]RFU61748.1 hypothetical protein D0466_16530 [Peribacillus glennii]